MKLYSKQTYNRQWLMTPGFLTVCVALFVSCPGVVMAQSAPQKFRTEVGHTTRLIIPFHSNCSEPHHLRIKNKITYVRFEQPGATILIRPNSSEQIVLLFDATGLENKVYRDKVVLECVDCRKGGGCEHVRHETPFEMTIFKPAAQARPPAPQVEWSSFAAVFSVFSETLAQLEKGVEPGDEETAKLIKRIERSIGILKAKWEASRPATAPKVYLESLQDDLEALQGLRKSGTGSEKKVGLRQDVQIVRGGFGSYLAESIPNQRMAGAGNTNQRDGRRHGSAPKALEKIERDLNIKAEHSVNDARPFGSSVEVSVYTKTNNRVVSGYEVWYATNIRADYPDLWKRFSTLSSPSTEYLSPGSYSIGLKKMEGVEQQIGGAGKKDRQQVDLRAP